MYILLAYFKMFVLCYFFFNIDLYMFDKINLLLLEPFFLLTNPRTNSAGAWVILEYRVAKKNSPKSSDRVII